MEKMMHMHDKQFKVCQFDKSYAAYQIPYAKYEGRLAQATRLKWEDLKSPIDASKRGPVFPQNPNRLSRVMGTLPEEANQSEAAFHLNIFSASHFKNKPVLFWIHGGGWLTGGGALPWYDGVHLVEQEEIVVVTMNYRIGALGAFYSETGPQNLGLSDLIQALSWVRESIQYFGGDPDNITVGGQSAGAWYTVALLGHEDAHQHIHKALLASFPGQINPLTSEDAQQLESQYQSYLAPQTIHSATVPQLLKAQNDVMAHLMHRQSSHVPTSFIPIANDGLSSDMIQQATEVSGGKIDVMAWVTQDEMKAFMPQDAPEDEVAALTNEEFKQPTLRLIQQFSTKGSRTIFQEIKGGNTSLGAAHCYDLPLLFGNSEQWYNAPMLEQVDPEQLMEMSTQLQHDVAQFMSSETPLRS